ncbi:MAG: tetratricopeptide repeat protein [Nitrospirae bacterium]|nr:tetratricopeptide repeat protein [Nitrospirota bacterium]
MQDTVVRPIYRSIAMLLGVPLVLSLGPVAFAEDPQVLSEETVAEQANVMWESGAIIPALEIIDQGIQDVPDAFALQKLRGDILATSRGPQEAVAAYETVLAREPSALNVRWAKWSVLTRWGQGEESIAELRRIAQIDVQNPLVHLRLAQELRKLDRLEESLESYKKAVELAPNVLSWRLALARARFDVLDYQGSDADVQYVLQRLPPGSPLELPAKNQLSQLYESMERGRRHHTVLTPDVTESQLKEWALLRADAWRLFEAGRYREAEPIYRSLLALNPKDPTAVHQLGLTLMQLGQCKDALAVFGKIADLDTSEENYTDTVYRMGQCLVDLEQWEEAFVQFQTLYDAAVEFEKNSKDVELPPETRVLDKMKIARWLDKVRPHVPELAKLKAGEVAATMPSGEQSPSTVLSEEVLLAKADERLKPHNPLDKRASLLGRDADFSWFRFVIASSKVMRDDFPTGAHEFIPLNPGDSFPTTQQEIYLVFGLVSASYDAVPLTARCYVETSGITGEQRAVAQDHIMTTMNDQSGYFMLSPPKAGWPPGLYSCGLFAGERTSVDTRVDEVRFRIIEPTRSS